MSNKLILDPCCGSRMFHFDRKSPHVVYGDIRSESHILCDGRTLVIRPDIEMDFREIPFPDKHFKMVVFDPPHLVRAGKKSWLALKYGKLEQSWKEDLRLGFAECFRVLDDYGTLIFKWNEAQINVKDVLALAEYSPIVGHISAKRSNTHWYVFLKTPGSD